jgi:hypothetical protein
MQQLGAVEDRPQPVRARRVRRMGTIQFPVRRMRERGLGCPQHPPGGGSCGSDQIFRPS